VTTASFRSARSALPARTRNGTPAHRQHHLGELCRKVGQGIGGGLAAFGIGVGGYVAGAATQSQGAIDSIRYITGFGPALFVGIGAAIMLAYPLTEERFQEVVREIAFRRAERGLGADKPPA
jgi:glucuronide carrier protein